MSQSTVYLVTGANRGIGFAIVSLLAARPDAVIFAGARNPAGATGLQELAKAHPGRFHVIKVVSADKENNVEAAKEIKRVAGGLDVVIANAAISDTLASALETPAEEMIRHFDINVNGPLVLFQTTYPLLKESKQPKFVTISTGLGSIERGAMTSARVYPYGASKAALNWVTRKLHHDFPDLIAFPISPGVVDTHGVLASGAVPDFDEIVKEFPPITPEESAQGVVGQIDIATRETHGGQFVDYTGLGKWGW
ncbi:NAD(P)-binding protein [Schizophyllum commune H4-8]|uniref:NAD(P)-binding protein n=1 Tax=Schizophyllum commune (strain H4-8 / FGSC 9210) TaxID=578458 RepID=D8QCM6_SCHCM|nr:NAD(P)-binding protein [Schizophyllum commune H4-8]KAI5889650.1 NAD(P)-binding protein [Schizophyllum commune H4-8]